jgi:hypothetical protein
MAPPRNLALCGAVTSTAFATLLLVCIISNPSHDAAELLSAPAAHVQGEQHNFFADLAPGGLIHKLPAASGNSALAKAEKKLSSYAYPRFPAFARSSQAPAATLARKMSLSEIEHTLQSDSADLLKDAGPSRAAIAINTPRTAIAANPPQKQPSLHNARANPAAPLADPASFPVGSPFPAKGARVIYIGGGPGSSEERDSRQASQRFNQRQSTIFVGGNAPSRSSSLENAQMPSQRRSAVGYDPEMPTEREALEGSPVYSQRLDVNNPNAPDMQQWRPAYRQPPLGDVDHGDSIGANDENQDDTRFSAGFRRPSLQQEFQIMESREVADRLMIRRLRGALQRVQEMSARAYTGAQAADVVLGAAAIHLRGGAEE